MKAATLRNISLKNLKSLTEVKLNYSRLVRCSSTAAQVKPKQDKMSSWQIHAYGDLSELQYSPQMRIPHITKPNEILVKVEAASVNPIDVAMIGGYGATALNLMRQVDNVEFPITLGRDFCGTIVSKGMGECNKLPVGTTVWGVVPVHKQGSHADYVIVDSNCVTEKPNNIDKHEAASTLYTALTAWSGLMFSGGLKLCQMNGLKALVLGASGGVGNATTQILKAGGANVTATCSSDAIPLVETFRPDNILDYSLPNHNETLLDCGRFDIVVDCAGLGSEYAINSQLKFSKYVTFTTPILKNFDDLGLVRGLLTSVSNLFCPNVKAIKNGGRIMWAYFVPSNEGINYIYDLVSSGKMIPTVEKVFKYSETPLAYKRVQDGHLRGKIVIDVSDSS